MTADVSEFVSQTDLEWLRMCLNGRPDRFGIIKDVSEFRNPDRFGMTADVSEFVGQIDLE